MTEKTAGAQGLLATLSERLREAATVKAVFGDPVTAAGKTVIPVARVTYGFGGGYAPQPRHGAEGASGGEDQPAGGGGGMYAAPIGVVEIDEDETRLVRFGLELHLGIAFGAGLLLGLALARLRHRRDAD
jgi:uncharacterized spore protein YtfJ